MNFLGEQNIRPKNSAPKFGHPKFVSQNSAPNSGSGGGQSPLRKFVPEEMVQFPKGPFRTKNTTTIANIVNYYGVVFLLRPPNLVRHGPFFDERKNVCNSQENGVRTRRAAIVNHPAVLKIVRVVNLLRVLFLVRRGPLGWGAQDGFVGRLLTSIVSSNSRCPVQKLQSI